MNLCHCGRKKFSHEAQCGHCRHNQPVRQTVDPESLRYTQQDMMRSIDDVAQNGFRGGSDPGSTPNSSSSDTFSGGGGESAGGGASGDW